MEIEKMNITNVKSEYPECQSTTDETVCSPFAALGQGDTCVGIAQPVYNMSGGIIPSFIVQQLAPVQQVFCNPQPVVQKPTSDLGRIVRPNSPTNQCQITDEDGSHIGLALVEHAIADVSADDTVCALSAKSLYISNSGTVISTIDVPYYWCNFCNFKSEVKRLLMEHMVSHRFSCKVCRYQGYNRSEVVRHSLSAHKDFKIDGLKLCVFLPDDLHSKLSPVDETVSLNLQKPLVGETVSLKLQKPPVVETVSLKLQKPPVGETMSFNLQKPPVIETVSLKLQKLPLSETVSLNLQKPKKPLQTPPKQSTSASSSFSNEDTISESITTATNTKKSPSSAASLEKRISGEHKTLCNKINDTESPKKRIKVEELGVVPKYKETAKDKVPASEKPFPKPSPCVCFECCTCSMRTLNESIMQEHQAQKKHHAVDKTTGKKTYVLKIVNSAEKEEMLSKDLVWKTSKKMIRRSKRKMVNSRVPYYDSDSDENIEDITDDYVPSMDKARTIKNIDIINDVNIEIDIASEPPDTDILPFENKISDVNEKRVTLPTCMVGKEKTSAESNKSTPLKSIAPKSDTKNVAKPIMTNYPTTVSVNKVAKPLSKEEHANKLSDLVAWSGIFKCAFCRISSNKVLHIRDHVLDKHKSKPLFCLDMETLDISKERYIFYCHFPKCTFCTNRREIVMTHLDRCSLKAVNTDKDEKRLIENNDKFVRSIFPTLKFKP